MLCDATTVGPENKASAWPRACGMATCATVPVGHVELPFGYTRQYSLQLFEPLHVHGDLPGALFRAGAKAYAVRRKPQPAGGVSAIAHLAAASPELLAVLAAT